MSSTVKPPFLTPSPKVKNLYYYTGRVRAFWKDLIFFSDQRNVAVVNVRNLYIHGINVTAEDIARLEKLVLENEWDEAPEFHSYVDEYPSEVPPSWPYKLSGKGLWEAKCAWMGPTPEFVEIKHKNEIVFMPISYYTGKVLKCFQEKILFGDHRNNVMVNFDDFYVNGQRFTKKMANKFSQSFDTLIHAYIIKLKVLAGSSSKVIGPEPHLPTWPKQHYTADMWVAKFAWPGDLPEIVKSQVGRFQLIHMNQWDNVGQVPWVRYEQLHGFPFPSKDTKDYVIEREKPFILSEREMPSRVSEREKHSIVSVRGKPSTVTEDDEETGGSQTDLDPSFVPVEQEEGLMKGCLLLANHQQGLMTSFVDVIAFTKENFYINGELFRSHMSLSDFFKCRKIPLSAWVVPLEKPKIIFHIKVVWRAVCAWYGNAPRDLENIKKLYENGILAGKLVETEESDKTKIFTHFMGNITSLSFASGVLKSKVSSTHTVKIFFKRRSLYMYGYKFHSSCRLLDKLQILESFTWSVLAHPLPTGTLQYQAIALWQYQYQPFIMMKLFQIIADTINPSPEGDIDRHARDLSPVNDESDNHMSGWITWVSENCGILQSRSNQADSANVYFEKSVLYVDGELVPDHVKLSSIDRCRQYNIDARPIAPKFFQGLLVAMGATMVWIGKKPLLSESPPKAVSPSMNDGMNSPDENECHGMNGGHMDMEEYAKLKKWKKKPSAEVDDKDKNERLYNELHAVEGIIAGSVLVTNDQQGLMICFNSIVAFTIKNLYVDGERFEKTHTSLSEFFNKKKIAVRAWVVPLKEPKVLFNCHVVCEAVCAWIGREPPNLKSLESAHQQRLLNDTRNLKKSLYPEVVFSYFYGRLIRLSASSGLIGCETPHGEVAVAFWNKAVFLNGVKIHRGSDLQNYRNILTVSKWCVLGYSVAPMEILGRTVRYCAIAIWLYADQHKIGRELSQIIFARSQDLPFDVLPINVQKEVIKGNVIVEGTESGSEGKIMCGWIVYVKGNVGIVDCVTENTREKTYVVFQNTLMWIDSLAMETGVSLHSFDHLLQCTLYAYTPHVSQLDGYKITYIASMVWIGKKPQYILVGPNLTPVRLELRLKTASLVEEVDRKLAKISLTDTQLPRGEGDDGETQDRLEEDSEEPSHKYRGKHITGKIIQKHKGGGVAQWHSIQLEGEVYIGFSRSDVYIDLSPMTRRTKLAIIGSRPCNFYVVPVSHYEVGDYTISLLATCGWIGSKPSHIPPPGTQKSAIIDMSNVYVTPVNKTSFDDKSQAELSSPVPQQGICSKSTPNVNRLPESSLEEASGTHTQPGAVPKDRSPHVADKTGYLGPQNGYVSHVPKSSTYEKTSVTTHTSSVGSSTPSQPKDVGGMWNGLSRTHLKGSIIELHSNVGRLEGADRSQHYFSRDHCYLYGVSLRNVELWHVLVQGQKVLYNISESHIGTMKVQGVWIGDLKVDNMQTTTIYIKDWCEKNLVPDGAREILC
ncbi:uncharacterized protein LOC121858513 isoform X2 [Homarus americanus]|uniref:uncharacterized protein LOC121858513 isoform X2 n=1 Tax=Homarus americanus TaxID=6706 RepID=UPI001C438915|nr:uncharacterized protein LOC121858513 isoform X2 [Homarus americanus]